MVSLGDLDPPDDNLLLIALGPGLGESVLVGWPPDGWLVVDSFQRSARNGVAHPALEVLEQFDAFADVVVLTHPHIDHTGGLAALIDRRKSDGLVGWWPDTTVTERWDTNNGSLSVRRGSAEHAIAAIGRAWREAPQSRWELSDEAAPLVRAEATITALTPLQTSLDHAAKRKSPDMNELSTAILLEWRETKLLLGGDLVNRRGWEGLEAVHGVEAFAATDGFKVAHHGSTEAQHPVALGGPPPTDRVLLGTPYNRGAKVPSYRPDGDVQKLLKVAKRLLISAHHGDRPLTAGTQDTSVSALAPRELQLPAISIEVDSTSQPVHDCWVAARWASDGTLIETYRGPGSLSVVP